MSLSQEQLPLSFATLPQHSPNPPSNPPSAVKPSAVNPPATRIIPPLYHGTTADALPTILEQGIRPTPERQWLTTALQKSNLQADETGIVFLTPLPQGALLFANAKAHYLRVRPGQYIRRQPGGISSLGYKLPLAPWIPRVKPALIRVDVPLADSPAVQRAMQRDSASQFVLGIAYRGVIPPEWLTVICPR